MLQDVDLSRSLTKQELKAVLDPLGVRLGELQRALRSAKVPTLLVFEGWDAAGKGTIIGALMQPLDPRGYKVHTRKAATEDEAMRPFLWRYWLRMPAAGDLAIFDRSWYARVLADRVNKAVPRGTWREAYGEINDFERLLADGGACIVKFFLHISRKEQRRRFRALERDPAEAWKVTEDDWREHRRYKDYVAAVDEMLERTSTAHAPWTVVEAEDRRFGTAKVFETLAAAWEKALKDASAPRAAKAPATPVRARTLQPRVFQRVDLTKNLSRAEYERQLDPLQQKMRALEHQIYTHRVPVVVVLEGWDAAGKGGAIRRLTAKLDPRGFEVISISAPNDDERAHHYLWRFWRHVPKDGHMAIFDRSWYGRVLVERVEGFCAEVEWRRAYQEINDFERQLASHGAVLIKIWLHLDKKTQLGRFREREHTGYKRWKITGEDWRNRKKWPRYEEAAAEMIERTSISQAPWVLVPAVDKYYARVTVLREVSKAVEQALARR
jgi:polyphosphate kinase 2 (PPK2 family)